MPAPRTGHYRQIGRGTLMASAMEFGFGWTGTLGMAASAFVLMLASAVFQARRGIGRLSFVPWDYAMILGAILLLVALLRAAVLWRDGWPFP